jgi:hypothetical protein
MAIKSVELAALARGEGCLGEAADDEPLFVLRADDPCAPSVVRVWCDLAQRLALHEPDKIAEARRLAAQMEDWQRRARSPRPAA